MRPILSEKNLVVILFIMVVITFSFAQADSKKMAGIYSDTATITKASLLGELSARQVNSISNNN